MLTINPRHRLCPVSWGTFRPRLAHCNGMVACELNSTSRVCLLSPSFLEALCTPYYVETSAARVMKHRGTLLARDTWKWQSIYLLPMIQFPNPNSLIHENRHVSAKTGIGPALRMHHLLRLSRRACRSSSPGSPPPPLPTACATFPSATVDVCRPAGVSPND